VASGPVRQKAARMRGVPGEAVAASSAKASAGTSTVACSSSNGKVWLVAKPLGYTRRRSEGKRWRKKYGSLNLVYSHRANFGGYREIGDARAYDDLLDDRARHHRIDHRRRRYAHVFAPDK
jgi:hypothetical protein